MLVRSKSAKKIDDFYKTLYAKLLRLLRLQAIVCPFSDAHRNESMVAPSNPEQLRDSYEVFAHSVSFKTFENIRHAELLNLADRMVADDPSAVKPIERREVLESDPDVWFDRIRVSVKPLVFEGELEGLKDWRQRTHEGISEAFQNVWKMQPERPWKYWRDLMAKGWMRSFINGYQQQMRRVQEIRDGLRQPQSLDDFIQPPVIGVFAELFAKFRAHSGSQEEAGKRVGEFLTSDEILYLPFLQIQSALYATIAKKAATQLKLPTQGFAMDVSVMSCLLPYCEAMFMDREIAGLWKDIQASPLRRLPYEAKVFSMVSKSDFLSYLEDLEQAVPEEQRRYSEQILG